MQKIMISIFRSRLRCVYLYGAAVYVPIRRTVDAGESENRLLYCVSARIYVAFRAIKRLPPMTDL